MSAIDMSATRSSTHGPMGSGAAAPSAQAEMAAALEATQKALLAQYKCFDAVMDHLRLGWYLFDAQGKLSVANRRMSQWLQCAEGEGLAGLGFQQLCQRLVQSLGPLDGGEARLEAFSALRHSGSKSAINLVFQSGQVLHVSHTPVDGGGFVHTLEDVTEKRRAEARANHLASHDVLTNLPNRRLLKQHIYVALNDALADCAVLCVALDRFKSVNDTLGHAGGDALLVEVSRRLRQCVRAGDTVGRLGGDEFVILSTSTAARDQVAALARRVVQEIARPFDLLGQSVIVGANVGIALAPHDGDSADQLIKRADMALFEAKREGHGVCHFFDPGLELKALERQALESDLRVALAQGQFELHYQPYFAGKPAHLAGFEALLRWNHPRRGRVSPLEFIPVAEELGLITDMGDWILQEACRTAAQWPQDVMISVNVSARQFINHDLVGSVEQALLRSGLRPSRLEIEITESALMENVGEVEAALERLRAHGIGLAMDDFGTGYSSLAYLRRFNFSKVKIDRSFVSALGADNQSLAIVRAIVALCDNLQIKVTAEGVETEAQADILRREHCDYLQGFLLGRPTPATQLSTFFSDTVQALPDPVRH